VLPPSRTHEAVIALEAMALCRCCLDWGGGLLWAVLPGDSPAAAVHRIAADRGGVAMRIGSSPQDTNDDAFTPLAEPVARLNRTLRKTLDPQGLFSPGRC